MTFPKASAGSPIPFYRTVDFAFTGDIVNHSQKYGPKEPERMSQGSETTGNDGADPGRFPKPPTGTVEKNERGMKGD